MVRRFNAINAVPTSPAPPVPMPRMTTSLQAPQARVKDPDKRGVSRYLCSRCEIEYKVSRAAQPVCPLCDEKRVGQTLREEIKKLVEQGDLLERELEKSRSELTNLDGMREAVSELGAGDRMFLKELIYRFRSAPTTRVKSMRATAERKDQAVGWVVEYQDVQPYEKRRHQASSVGGVMLAAQFSQAVKLVGTKGAMGMLAKSLSETMASADDSS